MDTRELEDGYVFALMVLGKCPERLPIDKEDWRGYVRYLSYCSDAEVHYLRHVMKDPLTEECGKWVRSFINWQQAQPPKVSDFYHRPPLHACKGEQS